MDPAFVVSFLEKTIKVAVLLAAPMLLVGLAVGILVSIFQAVTSIQDMTVTFIPKILAVILVLVFTFPWMLNLIVGFATEIFTNMPVYIR
jgi:flagellar biosynthetic protein FliQ